MSVTRCERCLLSLRADRPGGPRARVLRRSRTGRGVCVNCAATAFLKSTEPIASVLAARGPEVLLTPAAQAQFGAVLEAGHSDARAAEIDWAHVVSNWGLPPA